MSINNKHIATFLLGAAAGIAAMKYMRMSQEEKEFWHPSKNSFIMYLRMCKAQSHKSLHC